MLYRMLEQVGLRVSVVGLGTWPIGGTSWGGTNEDDALAAISMSLDRGVTLIDTAPLYGFGRAEELIASALAGRDREHVIISENIGLTWQQSTGRPFMEIEGRAINRDLRASTIRSQVERCLHRLQTDYLDIVFTNYPDPRTPVQETMAELMRLKAEGTIRAVGVSNVTVTQLKEYLAVGQVDAVQQQYHLLDRQLEREMLPFCQQHNIAVFAYSPLAQGLLTDTLDPKQRFSIGDMRMRDPRFSAESIARTNTMLAQLVTMRKKYNLNQTQLSIAWVISHPGVTAVLVGARNAVQAEDNAVGSVLLAPEDVIAIDRIIDLEAQEKHLPHAA
ncbi:MAG TPA: aldo/keto reductase [Armatimonadota bacterium]|nr:aldo/keto reductase [Armatimonadota bacterium]